MYSTAATEYSSSRCLLSFPPNRKFGSFKIKVMCWRELSLKAWGAIKSFGTWLDLKYGENLEDFF